MPITHATVKATGDKGTAEEWNAEHVITDPDLTKRSHTIIVAASNSLDTGRADYVCDGVDDQVQVQAAIDDLGVIGGTVLLLEGTYNFTGRVDLDNNVTLLGQGFGTVITQPNVTNLDTEFVRLLAITNGIVRNLKIDGNKAGQTEGDAYGVSIINSQYCKVMNCYITNIRTFHGVYVDTGDYCTITNNITTSCGAVGILFYGRYNNIVTNNITKSNGSYGISIGGAYSFIIANNECISNTFSGISINNSFSNVISNNTLVSNGRNGIELIAEIYDSITGNTFYNNSQTTNNTYSDILITATSTYNVVTGNTFQATAANKVKYHYREAAAADNLNTVVCNCGVTAATTNFSVQGANTIEVHNRGGTP